MKHTDIDRLIDEFFEQIKRVEGHVARRKWLKLFCRRTGLKMAALWRRLQERKRGHRI